MLDFYIVTHYRTVQSSVQVLLKTNSHIFMNIYEEILWHKHFILLILLPVCMDKLERAYTIFSIEKFHTLPLFYTTEWWFFLLQAARFPINAYIHFIQTLWIVVSLANIPYHVSFIKVINSESLLINKCLLLCCFLFGVHFIFWMYFNIG